MYRSSNSFEAPSVRDVDFNRCMKGRVGLDNLGNTCYMNTGLQCLSHIPELVYLFLSKEYKNKVNKNSKLGSHGDITSAFYEFLKNMWFGNDSVYNPRSMKSSIGRVCGQFAGYGQHDCQELIICLLDALHEDMNQVIERKFLEMPEFHTRNQTDADFVWNHHLSRNMSPIVDMFYGQLSTELRCPNCGNIVVNYDPISCIPVSLPPEKAYINLNIVDYSNPIPQERNQVVRIQISGDDTSCLINDILEKHHNLQRNEYLLIVGQEGYQEGSISYRKMHDNEPLSPFDESNCSQNGTYIIAYKYNQAIPLGAIPVLLQYTVIVKAKNRYGLHNYDYKPLSINFPKVFFAYSTETILEVKERVSLELTEKQGINLQEIGQHFYDEALFIQQAQEKKRKEQEERHKLYTSSSSNLPSTSSYSIYKPTFSSNSSSISIDTTTPTVIKQLPTPKACTSNDITINNSTDITISNSTDITISNSTDNTINNSTNNTGSITTMTPITPRAVASNESALSEGYKSFLNTNYLNSFSSHGPSQTKDINVDISIDEHGHIDSMLSDQIEGDFYKHISSSSSDSSSDDDQYIEKNEQNEQNEQNNNSTSHPQIVESTSPQDTIEHNSLTVEQSNDSKSIADDSENSISDVVRSPVEIQSSHVSSDNLLDNHEGLLGGSSSYDKQEEDNEAINNNNNDNNNKNYLPNPFDVSATNKMEIEEDSLPNTECMPPPLQPVSNNNNNNNNNGGVPMNPCITKIDNDEFPNAKRPCVKEDVSDKEIHSSEEPSTIDYASICDSIPIIFCTSTDVNNNEQQIEREFKQLLEEILHSSSSSSSSSATGKLPNSNDSKTGYYHHNYNDSTRFSDIPYRESCIPCLYALIDICQTDYSYYVTPKELHNQLSPWLYTQYEEKEKLNIKSTADVGYKEDEEVTLDDCMLNSNKIRKLDNDNQWYCPSCKTHVCAEYNTTIWRIPDILCIQLKRFEYSRSTSSYSYGNSMYRYGGLYGQDNKRKLDTLVHFPLTDFDLSPYLSPEVRDLYPDTVYDLIAVANHSGTPSFGHYYCYAKDENEGNSKWYTYNDSSCHFMSPQSVCTKAAYVLIYRKKSCMTTQTLVEKLKLKQDEIRQQESTTNPSIPAVSMASPPLQNSNQLFFPDSSEDSIHFRENNAFQQLLQYGNDDKREDENNNNDDKREDENNNNDDKREDENNNNDDENNNNEDEDNNDSFYSLDNSPNNAYNRGDNEYSDADSLYSNSQRLENDQYTDDNNDNHVFMDDFNKQNHPIV
ncbi:hypothetical protein WA158_003021 [Blastocystis sp. Blastoise]